MERIDFDEFREEQKIKSTAMRTIIKELKYEVIREGEKQYIVGKNKFNIENRKFLTNAVREYRQLVYVTYTKLGKMWWTEDIKDEKERQVAMEVLYKNPNMQLYDSSIAIPNIKPAKILVDKDAVVGITNQTAPETKEETTAITPATPQASIQALATALVEAQKAAAAPDPLAPQKALREAAEQGYLLLPEQLGQLIGMSKSTIGSKKSGFRKMGFQYEKVKEGSSTLWKVSQY